MCYTNPMFTSEIVTYHERSPDPLFPGCQNTRTEGTDGVVFQGIEPLVGTFCFVGRQSIIEAVGVLYGLSPEAVEKALTKRPPGRPPKNANG